jgi:hypothetical protein
VLSGRSLCDELIARPVESYRLCSVVVCDLETSRIGAPYIYDISHLRVNENEYWEYFVGCKGSWCLGLTTLPAQCVDFLIFLESGNLTLLEPSGPVQACTGTTVVLGIVPSQIDVLVFVLLGM